MEKNMEGPVAKLAERVGMPTLHQTMQQQRPHWQRGARRVCEMASERDVSEDSVESRRWVMSEVTGSAEGV
eukprot:3639604-Rhodomonas_salina.2